MWYQVVQIHPKGISFFQKGTTMDDKYLVEMSDGDLITYSSKQEAINSIIADLEMTGEVNVISVSRWNKERKERNYLSLNWSLDFI